jgi:hypothetical protein
MRPVITALCVLSAAGVTAAAPAAPDPWTKVPRPPTASGATGPFNEWLKRYKDHLTKDHIPSDDELETSMAFQFTMFGIPADKFQSTVVRETVILYMRQAVKVLDARQRSPRVDLVMPQ